ncbi:hypothetical protein TNCV_1288201 [Trichonephila clavipes]|nr:hypothetical protein TNCV_1288201 [Trichonephila clavipes]
MKDIDDGPRNFEHRSSNEDDVDYPLHQTYLKCIKICLHHISESTLSDCFVSMSTMSQQSHLTDSKVWRVVGRLEGGQTQAEVAQAIGVSQSVISRIWNRFLETGSAGRRPG